VNEQLTQVPETIKHRTLAVSTLNFILFLEMLKISPPKKKNIISKRKKTIVKENGESF
jgi:hypothetical protein